MNTANQNIDSAKPANPAESKQGLLTDIGTKWNKFSEQELGALKNRDELIDQVVANTASTKLRHNERSTP